MTHRKRPRIRSPKVAGGPGSKRSTKGPGGRPPQGKPRKNPRKNQETKNPQKNPETLKRSPTLPRGLKSSPTSPETPSPVRLQKAIAGAGITSRRKAEEMIAAGRVEVNHKVVSVMGVKVDLDVDIVTVDGRRIAGDKGPKLYILLNKPKGVISALSDPAKRPVVTDLLKRVKVRVWPVGRLDYDAEGALLLTNDGFLGNRLIHPRYSVPKKYMVKVRGVPSGAKLAKLERGISLADGRTLPCKARFDRHTNTKENSWIELTVYEGRNRLVKRMCQAIGHPVSKLKRLEFAGLKLGGLKLGGYRKLTKGEVERLKDLNRADGKE